MAFFYRHSASPIRPYDSTPSSSSSGRSSSSSSTSSSSTGTSSSNNNDSSPLSMLPSVIPDLRFEQSYLASIRGFIHELDPQEADREKRQAAAKGEVEDDDNNTDDIESRTLQASDEKRAGLPRKEDEGTPTLILGEKKTGPDHHGEPELWIGRLRIDWLPLLRVTLRDQILSPLIQGTFWAVVGVFLGQARGVVGAAWAQRRYRNRMRREEAAAAAVSNAPAGGYSSTRYI